MAQNHGIEQTKEDIRQNKKKKQAGAKQRLDLSALAISGNIVFSKTDIWAYYRIRNSVYDFLSHEEKYAYGKSVMTGFASLFMDRVEPLECQIISTSIPVDVNLWEAQMHDITEGWNRPARFNDYVREQAYLLRQNEFKRQVTYLGVHLGKRGAFEMSDLNIMEAGLAGAKTKIMDFLGSALKTPGYEISQEEEMDAMRTEQETGRVLERGALQATKATTEELLLLMKRQFWPAMPAPYLSIDPDNRVGSFDLSLELASAIRKRYRWLEITQMYGSQEMTGYRAVLSVAKMPKTTAFPDAPPFLYIPSMMGHAFTTYSRFRLLPNKKMKRELYKKQQEQKDQLQNMQQGGHQMNYETMEDVQEAEQLEYELSQNTNPWVEGSYRIVVETPTEEQLKNYCSELRQQYAAQDIVLTWSAGDQVDLFLEQMVGDRARIKSFDMLSNLEMIGATGSTIANDIGDPTWGDN